ncbi:pseudouridine synthase [Methylophaga sp. SB9B]|uniref:23S rRNA pseudouridine(2605) synthase RluB n=1 Tax=Methylophaga sp. SB9B TaxID=2570356 RepID=UPI0010A87C6F|nr:pseudouridine synthase [Methylophaga sp. SB9B]THK40883.1 pseudouridine synthase [Methylophaga sp. SB9B]
MAERIQKVLARAGYGSRRLIESWIKDGKLLVNGVAATLGDQISEKDRVTLEGRPLSSKRIWQQSMPQVLLYHKPVGEVCTRSDPEGRRTIYQSLPVPEEGRWVSVGRLDLNTSGLIILTTDGELANQLMHPSNEMDREYAVRVLGEVTSEMMQTLRDGVELEDGKAHFSDIQPGGGEGANTWFHVVIQEGRNREVRRLWESQGVQVSRLVRLRYGPVIMPNKLKPGRWMMLEGKELEYLYEEAGLKAKATKRGVPAEKISGKKEAPAPVEKEKAAKSTKWPDKSAKAAKKTAPRSAGSDTSPSKRGPRIRGRSDR